MAAEDWATAAALPEQVIPGLRPEPVKAQPCMVTDTPDHQFVLGRRHRTVVAGGCSGHGFKHASAIGEAVARTVTGEGSFAELDFLAADRFTG
ncbi:FAD-dependent oxidoreductase [Amycolatopsis alkalitolerans]|uniref:FAD-dependent oxidoreductase n=1 Tax=Amycolatopsis alkalitolerans TaxID=2547244 RepID=UPI00190FBB24|nr:FAD-dependent oxidoreductase [Amycolatopsis alkalitolerans]